MVANSAAALYNMAGQEVIRRSLLSQGAVQALVEPLNSTSTQVQVNTLRCLAALACDTETRTQVGIEVSTECSTCFVILTPFLSVLQLQYAGGLQPLVNLLRSNNKEVLQNACIAINVFASDEPTAVQIYQLG